MTKLEQTQSRNGEPASLSLSLADIMKEPSGHEKHHQAHDTVAKRGPNDKKEVHQRQDKKNHKEAQPTRNEHKLEKHNPKGNDSTCHNSHPIGIDVSSHNGKINWKKVKTADIDFAFIKATEGATFTDSSFQRNWKNSRDAGITRGAYHFFRPKTPVHDQVNNFVSAVKSLKLGDLPAVLDVENPRLWKGLTQKQSADRVIHWLSHTQKRLGVAPILYTNRSFLNDVLGNDERLAKYPLWLAEYRREPIECPEPYQCRTFWQQNDCAHVDGIHGTVDWNVFNGSRTQFHKLLKPAHKHVQIKK